MSKVDIEEAIFKCDQQTDRMTTEGSTDLETVLVEREVAGGSNFSDKAGTGVLQRWKLLGEL